VHENRPARLRCHHKRDTDQVRRETRPGHIVYLGIAPSNSVRTTSS
jgi:hypothetical protein